MSRKRVRRWVYSARSLLEGGGRWEGDREGDGEVGNDVVEVV